MKDIMLSVNKGIYLPRSEVFASINACMDKGIFMPAGVCNEMGWHYTTLRNSLAYQNQYTISEYIKRERVRRLKSFAEDGNITPYRAAEMIGMKIREANKIMKLILNKNFIQVRNEHEQRGAVSATGYRHSSYCYHAG